MSFALARQKGSVTRWDDFRSQRNKRKKRGSILSKNLSSKPKIGVWVRTLAELTSKLFLAGVVGYLLFAGYNFLLSSPRFQIQNISFKGNQVLSNPEVLEWVGSLKGKNLFAIDLAELNQRLSEHPWVKSSSLQRKFPKSLVIEITERVPYARVMKDQVYLMDNFGVILSPEKPEYRHLPLIIMGKSKEKFLSTEKALHSLKIMHYFNKLSFFKNNPLDGAVMKGHSRVLFVTRNQDLQIQMSMNELNEGFKNFMIVLDSLDEKNIKAQMIDLSFKDQVIIRENFKSVSTLVLTKSQTN
ncbi:MAG: FtsQ-type POTRA domain-containing protein [Nitrospinota bacterium]|nr:FtsQ-type POTRA domain-containing protein [Nitrospinota bacterium]